MRKQINYTPSSNDVFLQKLLNLSRDKSHFCAFISSNLTNNIIQSDFDWMCGFDALDSFNSSTKIFENIESFYQRNDWALGYISYDAKNEIENLSSGNTDYVGFPETYFFNPKVLFISKNNVISCHYYDGVNINEVLHQIESTKIIKTPRKELEFKPRISQNEYIQAVTELKKHIQAGDIYEINFCQEFYSDNTEIDPSSLFQALCMKFQAPFSSFLKLDNKYILSLSPERFLKKKGTKVYSQPIKGTAKRDIDVIVDEECKTSLLNSEKERSENVMIVDLVRNDLSKQALKGTVKVDEFFGIYSFPTVHQMISTISCEVDPNTNNIDMIKSSFPMGSMTGAPKVEAMKLIEEHEKTKRGVFSGAIGYITPEGDFDFNVVIRTLLYNKNTRYLSLSTGGAITIQSDPEKEYEESLLKAQAFFDVLSKKSIEND